MYVSLYRRYRPQSFADVVGQDPAVAVLLQGLVAGKTGQAYLFSGPRGSGKTSLARLLAKAVNCSDRQETGEPCGSCRSCRAITEGDSLDVTEIDGASNNGVEEVRELKAKVALAPFSSPVKVYIIDEVHMLSTAAFNALLKTLEEPPKHVLFILATTEPHKVPVTIRSRCRHIPFRRIAVPVILDRLRHVCEAEEIGIEEEALWEIARQADGALRDALSLLEQALSLGGGRVTLDAVRALSGGGTRVDLEEWARRLLVSSAEADSTLREMIASGVSPERLLDGAFLLFRDLWICRNWGETALDGLDLSPPERSYLLQEAKRWAPERLWQAMNLCQSLMGRSRLGLRGDVLAGLLSVSLSQGGEDDRSRPAVRGSAETVSPPPPFPEERRLVDSPPPRKDPTAPTLRSEEPSGAVELPSEPSCAAEATVDSLLARLADRDLALAASFLHCRATLDSGRIDIVIPESEPFPLSLLTSQRGIYQLALAVKEAGFSSGEIHYGDRSSDLAAEEPGLADEETSPFLIPPARRKKNPDSDVAEGQDVEVGSSSPSSSEGEGTSLLTSQVDRVLRWTSGDLLLLKAEKEPEAEEEMQIHVPELDEEGVQE